ncbi:hypothetical protein [Rhodopirellula europaea]|uniref:hypothetical protein n=1 Tax=Rhodopirellula europaea TaxID=1263866 RepID=UPI001360B3D8|nr:hypothetical protein [Rhodopirellula europaea]
MNAPRNDRDSLRISIGACFVVTAAIAFTLAVYKHYGLAGAAFALAVIACTWFVLSRMSVPSLLPINSRRLTVTELFTLLGLCAILYGLSLPTVSSIPRGRPPVALPPPATNAAIQSGG